MSTPAADLCRHGCRRTGRRARPVGRRGRCPDRHRRSAAQVRKERRIIHERDVLGDLVELATEVGRGIYRMTQIRVPLLTLRDADACPVLRAFADANPTPDGRRKLDRLLDRPYP